VSTEGAALDFYGLLRTLRGHEVEFLRSAPRHERRGHRADPSPANLTRLWQALQAAQRRDLAGALPRVSRLQPAPARGRLQHELNICGSRTRSAGSWNWRRRPKKAAKHWFKTEIGARRPTLPTPSALGMKGAANPAPGSLLKLWRGETSANRQRRNAFAYLSDGQRLRSNTSGWIRLPARAPGRWASEYALADLNRGGEA
jgi:hypothetical protein